MDDETDDGPAKADSTDDSMDIQSNAVTATYKVLEQLDAASGVGVLGQNDAGSGTPIGVIGAVPDATSAGYGFATPHDVRIEGTIDTAGTDFVVAAGTTDTHDARGAVLGHSSNAVLDGAVGATVSGSGFDDGTTPKPNQVFDNYGTVGGGKDNQAGSADSDPTSNPAPTVGGGKSNTANGREATVAGGHLNDASGDDATVGGGSRNDATAEYSTVGGGTFNVPSDRYTTIGGGSRQRSR